MEKEIEAKNIRQTKINEFTTIAIKKDEDISKTLEVLKNKIEKETSMKVNNSTVLNIIFDCIDKEKLANKIKLLKEATGK